MIFCVLVVVLGFAAIGETHSVTLAPAMLLGAWSLCTFYALLAVVRTFLRGANLQSMGVLGGGLSALSTEPRTNATEPQ